MLVERGICPDQGQATVSVLLESRQGDGQKNQGRASGNQRKQEIKTLANYRDRYKDLGAVVVLSGP